MLKTDMHAVGLISEVYTSIKTFDLPIISAFESKVQILLLLWPEISIAADIK